MTDDASDTRLTSGVTPSMRSYWENTVLMYDDLAEETTWGARRAACSWSDWQARTGDWRG